MASVTARNGANDHIQINSSTCSALELASLSTYFFRTAHFSFVMWPLAD